MFFFNFSCFFRRSHTGNTAWHATPVTTNVNNTNTGRSAIHNNRQSPERLKGATYDLFELLEKAQSSRLDDQRCVLPAYFKQVGTFYLIINFKLVNYLLYRWSQLLLIIIIIIVNYCLIKYEKRAKKKIN